MTTNSDNADHALEAPAKPQLTTRDRALRLTRLLDEICARIPTSDDRHSEILAEIRERLAVLADRKITTEPSPPVDRHLALLEGQLLALSDRINEAYNLTGGANDTAGALVAGPSGDVPDRPQDTVAAPRAAATPAGKPRRAAAKPAKQPTPRKRKPHLPAAPAPTRTGNDAASTAAVIDCDEVIATSGNDVAAFPRLSKVSIDRVDPPRTEEPPQEPVEDPPVSIRGKAETETPEPDVGADRAANNSATDPKRLKDAAAETDGVDVTQEEDGAGPLHAATPAPARASSPASSTVDLPAPTVVIPDHMKIAPDQFDALQGQLHELADQVRAIAEEAARFETLEKSFETLSAEVTSAREDIPQLIDTAARGAAKRSAVTAVDAALAGAEDRFSAIVESSDSRVGALESLIVDYVAEARTGHSEARTSRDEERAHRASLEALVAQQQAGTASKAAPPLQIPDAPQVAEAAKLAKAVPTLNPSSLKTTLRRRLGMIEPATPTEQQETRLAPKATANDTSPTASLERLEREIDQAASARAKPETEPESKPEIKPGGLPPLSAPVPANEAPAALVEAPVVDGFSALTDDGSATDASAGTRDKTRIAGLIEGVVERFTRKRNEVLSEIVQTEPLDPQSEAQADNNATLPGAPAVDDLQASRGETLDPPDLPPGLPQELPQELPLVRSDSAHPTHRRNRASLIGAEHGTPLVVAGLALLLAASAGTILYNRLKSEPGPADLAIASAPVPGAATEQPNQQPAADVSPGPSPVSAQTPIGGTGRGLAAGELAPNDTPPTPHREVAGISGPTASADQTRDGVASSAGLESTRSIRPTALTPPAADGGAGARSAPAEAANTAAKPTLNLPPLTTGPLSLRVAAADGDAEAQFIVASRLAQGFGTKRDPAAASRWYMRAASSGHARAQYRLAALYERGNGVAADAGRAKAWYTRAAQQGNVKAMHNLAVLFAGQSGGAPNYVSAAHWFEQAAMRNLADSQFNLAILYANGLGVTTDHVGSHKWFALAAKQGDKDAERRLTSLERRMDESQIRAAREQVANWQPLATDENANKAVAWKPKETTPVPATLPGLAIGLPTSDTLVPVFKKQPVDVASVQRMLAKLGMDPGGLDGKVGSKTTAAVKRFQAAHGMVPTGVIDEFLFDRLKTESRS